MKNPVRACAPGTQVPICWRLRQDGPLPGTENMRIDEDLLEAQRAPGTLPALRLFLWREPTLSFGRLQTHQAARAEGGGAPVVRRPTGGGMVLHGDDLSFSLVWRRDHPLFPRCLGDVYRNIHETAQAALKDLGFDTTLHPAAEVRAPATSASGRTTSSGARARGVCFSEPVEHDVMWKGRKVVGGAIRVTGWGRLYQGNVLLPALGLTASEAAAALKRSFQTLFFRQPPE